MLRALSGRIGHGGKERQRGREREQKKKLGSGEGMGESVEVDEVAGLSRWRIEQLKKRSEERTG